MEMVDPRIFTDENFVKVPIRVTLRGGIILFDDVAMTIFGSENNGKPINQLE